MFELGQSADYGNYWQGRYTMPFAVGLPLVFAWRPVPSEWLGDRAAPIVAWSGWIVSNVAFVAERALGLEHGDVGGDHRLHRRRDERAAGAALWAIRLGDHPDHLPSLAEQRPQRGHRELRSPEEDDPHHSDGADSGCTSLR